MAEDRKPCAGCGVEVWWVRHERTGNPAPLVKASENIKPNIAVYEVVASRERTPGFYYTLKPTLGEPLLYINHFSDCPKAANFKRR